MGDFNFTPAWAKRDDNGQGYVVLSALYEDYKNWCMAQGEKPVTAMRFGKELVGLIPNYHARLKWKKIDGKAERVVLNLGHRSEAKF